MASSAVRSSAAGAQQGIRDKQGMRGCQRAGRQFVAGGWGAGAGGAGKRMVALLAPRTPAVCIAVAPPKKSGWGGSNHPKRGPSFACRLQGYLYPQNRHTSAPQRRWRWPKSSWCRSGSRATGGRLQAGAEHQTGVRRCSDATLGGVWCGGGQRCSAIHCVVCACMYCV